MFDKINTTTLLLVAGYLSILGSSIYYRFRFDDAVAALPQAERAALGWEGLHGGSTRREQRRITSRLILHGFPDWTSLPERTWQDLSLHRVLAFAAFFYLAVVPAVIWNVLFLIPVIGAPITVLLLLRAWWVGPWPARRPSGQVR
jgi:hypothetical protein